MEKVAERISLNLSDKVEWMSFEEIMNFVVSNPDDHPIPECRKA